MDSIGGFKLVRRLGSGSRSEVLLGHSESVLFEGAPRTAAIKVFRTGVFRESIELEIEALARTSHRHVLRLDDLTVGADGRPVLVVQRLGTTNLAQLLLNRHPRALGEAVTILAPVVEAVTELHRSGIAHGALRLGSVQFDDFGAPVLTGFGHVIVIGPAPDSEAGSSLTPAQLSASAAVNDLEALRGMVRAVLDATEQSATTARLTAWLDHVDFGADPAATTAELLARVFDLAEALPISVPTIEPAGEPDAKSSVNFRMRRGDASSEARRKTPASLTPSTRSNARRKRRRGSSGITPAGEFAERQRPVAGGERTAAVRESRDGIRPSGFVFMMAPEWVESIVDDVRRSGGTSTIRVLLARVGRACASVRRPIWIAAGSVAVLLVAALVVIPAGDAGDARADQQSTAVGTGDVESPAPVVDEPGGRGRVEGAATATLDATRGEDPVAATWALLSARAECFRSLSIMCLDTVDQTGSAVWEADGFAIREGQERGGPRSGDTTEPRTISLVERLGDSAILSVTYADAPAAPAAGAQHSTRLAEGASSAPVSGAADVTVLIVKGDGRWLLRDYIGQ